MDVNKTISKRGPEWRCREHPSVPGDFICLEGEAKNRIKCFKCLSIDPSLLSNVLSMSYVLAANDHEILEAYPPLNDQELSEKLRNSSFQQSIEEIDDYFSKLREGLEKEIRAAQQRVKNIFVKQEQANKQLLEGYFKIAEIDKLKKLIVSERQGAENDLDNFIKEKWNKAEENRKVILNLMNEYETGQQVLFDEPNRIAQEIIEILQSITFAKQQSQSSQKFNLFQSTLRDSGSMEITQIDNFTCKIKKGSGNTGQVFLDPILSPSQKYIFHIELNQKPGNSENFFQFGLVEDWVKDDCYANEKKMCYCDKNYFKGITKVIKGSFISSENKPSAKRIFEVRLHLDKKILKVGFLPDYSSIVELDEPNKINPKTKYRFFFSMKNIGDMITISNFRIVSIFDQKM